MGLLIDRQDWLKARQSGLGGSEVAAVLGLSPYKTPYQVWLDKKAQEVNDSTSEPAFWGTVLEEPIAQVFSQRSGLKIQRVNQMMRHVDHSFALANIDRAIVNPDIAGNVRFKSGALTTDQILEVKTASAYLKKMWGTEDDHVPDYYMTQCQWYLGITGVELCHLAVLIGGQEYRHYKITRDDELITMLLDTGKYFWETYVESNVEPDPQTLNDCALRWSTHSNGRIIEADNELIDIINQYRGKQSIIKNEESLLEDLKFQIVKTMEDAEAIVGQDGKTILTYKGQTANRIDSKAFRAAHPDLADQFSKTSTSRVLRIK